jgi:uncharacterized protein
MSIFYTFFPSSGVTTWVFIPPVVAFVVSVFSSLAGLSGAFILLPFQMSALGFTSPAVSATNFVYNIVAIPSGVYQYCKEGRMAWPLAWVINIGTLPGILIGYYIRILYFPDPRLFKFFVGLVLLSIGGKLFYELTGRAQSSRTKQNALDKKFAERLSLLKTQRQSKSVAGLPPDAVIKTVTCNIRIIEYEFWGERFQFSVPAMFLLAVTVGIIGGIYGIGGGVIIAPFCVTVFHLPIYTVAGAALLASFITSIVGVFFYSMLPAVGGVATSPDWALGLLFGVGGLAGMYIGARLQKYIPQNSIKLMLGIIVTSLALWYIMQYFAYRG